MEAPDHSLNALFEQLGLPATDSDIERFIAQHKPLANHVKLAEAPFWTRPQSVFLQEAIDEDADWVEVVDHFDAQLRE